MNIGVSLILQATGEELQSWPNLPPTITYKGETRTGAIVGAQVGGDALLVDRVLDAPPPAGNPPVTGETAAFDGTQVIVTRSYGPPDLTPLKLAAKNTIDANAELARLRYITPGAGQALEYQEASDEASRYVITNGAGAYPMLQASVNAGEAPDLATAASIISAREAAWASIGAQIRQLRIAGKLAVDAAQTPDAIAAASNVVFP